MKHAPKLFAEFLRVTTAIVVALVVCPAAFAQITVTNATFPAAGDTLKMAIASNPAIAISVYGPPGGNQVWDLSDLQQGTIKNLVFKPASQGTVGAQVPGAELFTVPSPGTEEYYNVTSNKFELQAYYGIAPYDLVSNNLFNYNPPLTERRAPMNFFDINAVSSSILEPERSGPDCCDTGFVPSYFPPPLIAALPFTADYFRYRVQINRTDVADAWGSLSIPGGTYNVLREKRSQYREVPH